MATVRGLGHLGGGIEALDRDWRHADRDHAVTLAPAATVPNRCRWHVCSQQQLGLRSTIFQGVEVLGPGQHRYPESSNIVGPSSVTFGNLTINFTSDPGGPVNCSGGLKTINGDLTIQSTRASGLQAHRQHGLHAQLGWQSGHQRWGPRSYQRLGDTHDQPGRQLQPVGRHAQIVGNRFDHRVHRRRIARRRFTTSGGTLTNANIDWRIAAGKTVALDTDFGAGSWVNAGRSMAVNGALQINGGAYPGTSGTWTYGPGAALIFNTSGPPSWGTRSLVAVRRGAAPRRDRSGAAGHHAERAADGGWDVHGCRAGGEREHLTLNGTCASAPAAPYRRAGLWPVCDPDLQRRRGLRPRPRMERRYGLVRRPANIRLSGNTTLDYPNGGSIALSVPGSLAIDPAQLSLWTTAAKRSASPRRGGRPDPERRPVVGQPARR